MTARARSTLATLITIGALSAAVLAACGEEFSSPEESGTGGSSGTDGGKGGKGGSAGNPNGKDNGVPCTDGATCKSGSCADGVCCDGACDGACVSCKIVGKEGACTPQAAGTDPDVECAGSGGPTGQCAGKCDGSGKCAFPTPDTPCGNLTCVDGKLDGFLCDGAGTCTDRLHDCAPFDCSGTSCFTQCSGSSGCGDRFYCTGSSCVGKHDVGGPCSDNLHCKNGNCVGDVCCESQCAAPATCATGKCMCGDQACAVGDPCIEWFFDGDGDTFGVASNKKLGCTSVAPAAKYVKTSSDCDDSNNKVFPGQTQFFPQPRGDGKYDYDCDNVETKQYPKADLATCTDCGVKIANVCHGCGATLGPVAFGFGCNTVPKCTTLGFQKGYDHDVACGGAAQLWHCVGCTVNTTADTFTTPQGCR